MIKKDTMEAFLAGALVGAVLTSIVAITYYTSDGYKASIVAEEIEEQVQ